MKHFLRLTDYTADELEEIFKITEKVRTNSYQGSQSGKSFLLFFPQSSIRTRVTFEKGIGQLGGRSILFPGETLDKKEEIRDVIGYLNNWIECIVVRHRNIAVMEEMTKYSKVPIINGMTDINHPCEILTDLFSLSPIRRDFQKEEYLFVGGKGNIGLAWKEAADVFGLPFTQCCPKGYEMDGVRVEHDVEKAMVGKDIILTDPITPSLLSDFEGYTVTYERMKKANSYSILNPCPPFYRGEEVSDDVISSEYFVGYEFKKNLLYVQQAILLFCLES